MTFKLSRAAAALIWATVFFFSPLTYGQQFTQDNRQIDNSEVSSSKGRLNALSTERFEKKVFIGVKGELPYRMLSPKVITPGKKYPLVITFHNSSRIGNDNQGQLEPLARIWLRDEIYDKYNCFVIAPQFNRRSSEYVKDKDGRLTAVGSSDVKLVIELIAEAEREYPVDRNRIYLVGYSMGASTAQNLLSMAPGNFAALVSIAGVPDFSNIGGIRGKKIWLIHGKKDLDNLYQGSEALYGKLKGDSGLSFTSFEQLDHHNIMIPYLLNEDIPGWLFAISGQ